MKQPARILFGGSFSPFHNGHLEMVHAALKALPEAELWFIPAGSPPHKAGPALSFEQRCQMLERLAMSLGPRVKVCTIEGRLSPPTYTISTLRALRHEDPDFHGKLYFLIGGDSLRDLRKWRSWRELLDEVSFLIVERPGVDTEAALRELEPALPPEQIEDLRRGIIASTPSELSSTSIRKGLQAQRALTDSVPREVADFLVEHKLLSILGASPA